MYLFFVTVVNCHLDILPDTIHEVLYTKIEFIVIYIYITDVIYFYIVSCERVFIRGYYIPVLIVLCQGRRT